MNKDVRRKGTWTWAGFVIPTAVLATACILFLPLIPALCVEKDSGHGQSLFLVSAAAPLVFEISYTHSVNKGRVADLYTAGPEGLTLTATRFVSYGAGMSDPEPGNTFSTDDGCIEIGHINMHISVLHLAVGVIAGHELSCNGRTYVLTDIWPPQTALAISYRNCSVFDYMRSTCHDRKKTDIGRGS